MGIEEKIAVENVNGKKLGQEMRMIRDKAQEDIQKVLYGIYNKYGFTVSNVHIQTTKTVGGANNELTPLYSVSLTLDY